MDNVYVKLYRRYSIMMGFYDPGLIKWIVTTKIRFYRIQKKRAVLARLRLKKTAYLFLKFINTVHLGTITGVYFKVGY